MLVIIEIKGTDWDAIPADRVMGTCAVICASSRPTSIPPSKTWRQASGRASWALCSIRPALAGIELLASIEATAGEQAVQVTWYHDVDWRR